MGVRVESVQIRDVTIPDALQDAMSRQAQAERERQARIILGESETQVAAKFMEAAKLYEQSPTALHLRAMNMLYEGMKDKASTIIVPSSALETMNLGAINMAALQNQLQIDRKRRFKRPLRRALRRHRQPRRQAAVICRDRFKKKPRERDGCRVLFLVSDHE